MTADEVLEMAEAALKQGDPASAEHALLQQWPSMSGAPADALHCLGMVRVAQQRLGEAEDLLKRAAESQPQSLRHHIALGHALSAAGKHGPATDAYAAAMRIDGGWPGLATTFSQSAYRAGRLQEAEQGARFATSYMPDANAWNALSGALRGQGRGQDALNAAEEALMLDPSHLGAIHSRGAALLLLGRAKEALEQFDTLAALGVAAPVLSLNRGAALEMLGRKAEADAIYADAAGRWPNYPNLQQQLAARRRQ